MTSTSLKAGHAALLADRGPTADADDSHPTQAEANSRDIQLEQAAAAAGWTWTPGPPPKNPKAPTPPTSASHEAFWATGGPR